MWVGERVWRSHSASFESPWLWDWAVPVFCSELQCVSKPKDDKCFYGSVTTAACRILSTQELLPQQKQCPVVIHTKQSLCLVPWIINICYAGKTLSVKSMSSLFCQGIWSLKKMSSCWTEFKSKWSLDSSSDLGIYKAVICVSVEGMGWLIAKLLQEMQRKTIWRSDNI